MKVKFENMECFISKITAQPLVIYGMGYFGNFIAQWCDENKVPYVFADRNAANKQDITDQKVIPPEALKQDYPNANIVIASINYYDEIKANLQAMGYHDSCILSYLLFWPKKIPWDELEEQVDWEAVRERAKIFARWIDPSAQTVADYSAEKNFLKDLLPSDVQYYSPQYIRIHGSELFADFGHVEPFNTDVSSCLAVLMSFENPEVLLEHICRFTRRSIIVSYVTTDKLPDINFRRSINYVNDFTERQLLAMFAEKGFFLKQKETDPFDTVHTVYLFEKK